MTENSNKITITKIFTFHSAHYLPSHEKCGRMHGHSYKLELELKGSIQDNGMVMDFGEIKDRVQPIIDVLDHRCLNEVSGLEIPTAENIVLWIKEKLEIRYPNINRLRLYETDTAYAEWRAQ